MAATAAKQPEPVVDLETVPSGPTVPATRTSDALTTFERLATAPNMDVDRLERLMQLYERLQARSAEEQFNAAMSSAQKQMRPIAADSENPQTRSRYASYAQLDRALRPVYTEYGFGLSFDTGDSPKEDHVRVLCYATHGGGHARTYHIDMPADGKGAKGGDVMTKTHAAGAAMSYGMRYLLKMIWNVAVGEEDRDGNVIKPRAEQADAPAGYEDWLTDLAATADDSGTPKLMAAFNQSSKEYRRRLTGTNAWEALKARAAPVGR